MFDSYFNEFESLVKATDKRVEQINRQFNELIGTEPNLLVSGVSHAKSCA